MRGHEALGQRRFTGARFGRDRDNPSPAIAGNRESIIQSPQLFFTLEQVDSGIPIELCPPIVRRRRPAGACRRQPTPVLLHSPR
jgi:hypothetical protein